MTATSTPRRAGPHEITQLLAWARRLSAAGPDADPAERVAYLAAKTDLLARITDHHPDNHDNHGGHRDRLREEQR